MKWAVFTLAAAVLASGFLYYTSKSIRADQGFVQDSAGHSWRMTRMQRLGLGEEMVAVYERVP